jgi:hypothetical protein
LQTEVHSIAYFGMRFWVLSACFTTLVVAPFVGQTIDIGTAKQTETPAYRPIVLGTGPTALVNRIDTQSLLNNGQKDGMVMFTCLVNKNGNMVVSALYRPSPNTEQLQQELKRRLVDAVFVPGIYNHAPVDAVYYGTVTFVVVQGKPRLRIFSNQEYAELRQESDFIGPQPIFGGESGFVGLRYPPAAEAQVPVDGIADIKLKIDDKGNVLSKEVVGEHPPLIGFGAQALMDLEGAKFIPAFRAGKPVACEVTLPLFYPQP